MDQTQIIRFYNIVSIAMLSLYFIKYIIKTIHLLSPVFHDYKPSCKDPIKIKLRFVVIISSFVMGRYDVEDMAMKTKRKKI